MEDSTVYPLQENEVMKQKLSTFRETLMTLKKGTSTQDFQRIKNKFDELKLQMSQVERLKEEVDEKQHIQSEVDEEHVIPFTSRLITVNPATEEMSRELFSILPTSKKKDASGENIVNREEETEINRFTSAMKNEREINALPTPFTNEPSFMQLRNLANSVTPLLQKQEIIAQDEPIEDKETERQKRHFNSRYFQMIDTHPDRIYNGLYKNVVDKEYFQFKNTEQNLINDSKENYQLSERKGEVEKTNQLEHANEDLTTAHHKHIANDSKNNHYSSDIISEIGTPDISASIEGTTESLNTAPPILTESTNEIEMQPIISELNEIERTMPSEEIVTDSITSDVESKKQKGSFLFNLFRK